VLHPVAHRRPHRPAPRRSGNIITANTTNLVIINQFQPIAVYFTLPENQLPR